MPLSMPMLSVQADTTKYQCCYFWEIVELHEDKNVFFHCLSWPRVLSYSHLTGRPASAAWGLQPEAKIAKSRAADTFSPCQKSSWYHIVLTSFSPGTQGSHLTSSSEAFPCLAPLLCSRICAVDGGATWGTAHFPSCSHRKIVHVVPP